jgi:glycerol-3-phosphate dehydrogenase
MMDSDHLFDLLIVGGGINGAGIARDASGRGLSVALSDKGDFAGATSWASSKLIHGGLRYLENMEFSLVRESLREREVMLRIAPHLTRPIRFVMPHVNGKGRAARPVWLIRLGLWFYDHLGGIRTVPGSEGVDLASSPFGEPLKPGFKDGFIYSDVQVDDARLTLANLQDAAQRGASIFPRTRLVSARRAGNLWLVKLQAESDEPFEISCRAIVNACGPWAGQVHRALGGRDKVDIQLVRGSHIIVPRLYAGDHAYTLQHDDGRIVFLIPFGSAHTMIGTTEVRMSDPDVLPQASPEEIEYLCHVVNGYLRKPISPADVVWHFAGVRPLLNDGQQTAARISREYRFIIDHPQAGDAPLLTIVGGKLTTYRRLAEKALAALASTFDRMGPSWTATATLPRRTIDAAAERGHHFGAGLYERDVRYFIEREWAHNADDILWRRTKKGLGMTLKQRSDFSEWLEFNR